MPALPDAPPLMADANARFRKPRLTPLRVFALTFVIASLLLWITAIPAIRAVGEALFTAWKASPLHEAVDERLHRDPDKDWRPKLD